MSDELDTLLRLENWEETNLSYPSENAMWVYGSLTEGREVNASLNVLLSGLLNSSSSTSSSSSCSSFSISSSFPSSASSSSLADSASSSSSSSLYSSQASIEQQSEEEEESEEGEESDEWDGLTEYYRGRGGRTIVCPFLLPPYSSSNADPSNTLQLCFSSQCYFFAHAALIRPIITFSYSPYERFLFCFIIIISWITYRFLWEI